MTLPSSEEGIKTARLKSSLPARLPSLEPVDIPKLPAAQSGTQRVGLHDAGHVINREACIAPNSSNSAA
jgi:hypothetical protein